LQPPAHVRQEAVFEHPQPEQDRQQRAEAGRHVLPGEEVQRLEQPDAERQIRMKV